MKKKYFLPCLNKWMRQRKNVCVLLLILLFSSLSAVWAPLKAQYSMGTTGLMNIPTADMQPDGTFMAGGNFMPSAILPPEWNYSDRFQ